MREIDQSPYCCDTCKNMEMRKKHVDRFGVPGGEFINVEYCKGKEIHYTTHNAGRDHGLCCHSDIKPLLFIAQEEKPLLICTLKRNPEEKAKYCTLKKPSKRCYAKRNGKTCFFIAERTDTGYKMVQKTDNHGRAVD
jgi:hypothetical protein